MSINVYFIVIEDCPGGSLRNELKKKIKEI
jgi:hypothetical protein